MLVKFRVLKKKVINEQLILDSSNSFVFKQLIMRKLSLALFGFVALTMLFSCSGNKALELSLQPTASDTFTYQTINNTETKISIMGMDQIVMMEQTTDQEYKIKDIASDGTVNLTVATTAIKIEQTNPMMNMSFDSEKPEEAEPKGTLDGLSELIGKEIDVKLSKTGELVSVNMPEDMFNGVFDNNPGGDQVKQQMEGLFGEQSMKSSFTQLTGFYPEQPVKVGDSWTKENLIETGMKMNVKTTYTLRERKGGVAMIDFKSDVATVMDGDGIEMMGMKMSYDLKGTQEGTITVNEKTGWASKTEGEQDMKGKMNMSGGAMGDMSADMVLTTTYSYVKKN